MSTNSGLTPPSRVVPFTKTDSRVPAVTTTYEYDALKSAVCLGQHRRGFLDGFCQRHGFLSRRSTTNWKKYHIELDTVALRS